MKIKLISYLALAAVLVGFSYQVIRAEGKERGRGVSKVAGTPVRTYLNINNISTVFTNFGISDIDVQEANSGFVFPKGSHKTAVFASGFLWGGKVAGEVRVGGSAYRTGLQAGKIKPDGTPEDPDLPKNRIYRVRPDYKTAKLTSEVADEGQSEDVIRTQYDKDWKEWPVDDGAPWTDINGNGVYNPDVDIAGVKGADQTIWYVANDLNTGLTTNLYGANPIGLEMQVTVWAYSQQGALGNMLFRRYLLINKSATTIDSMYVSQWSDVDDGNSTDDYAGCDVGRSLGFVYNANPSDATYSPLPPPAVGFDFFQGPVVNSPGDSAIFRGQRVAGKKNLPMTAFYYFARGDANVTDPTQGSYEGTTQFYNFFQGRIGRTGEFFKNPITGQSTTFALTGDAQTGNGWVDGQILPAGDRRIGLASGPFTMAVGDTQEVVIAEIAAGAIPGVDRLSAIGLLKYYDDQAQVAYNNFFDLPVPPPSPKVTATELDHEIVLDWGSDLASINAIESSNSKGFKFQGYNVYQLPSAASRIDNATRIATYDLTDGVGKIKDFFFDTRTGEVLVTVNQFGTDQGIKRFISIKNDALRGGTSLINGIRYYFAVTAYNYNPDPAVTPNNIENTLSIFTVVPHSENPGVRDHAGTDESLTNITHESGIANAVVAVRIVDPTKLTGAQYSVGWSTQPDKFSASYFSPEDPDVHIPHVEMQGSLVLNETGTSLSYTVKIIDVDSLTGPITGAHFHNSPPDTSGPVVKTLNFTYSTVLGKQVATATGVWSSSDTAQPLTPSLVTELIAGNIYTNIHTAANPAGEIRMQYGILSYPWYLNRGSTRLLSYQQNYSLDSSYFTTDGLQVLVGNLQFAAPITFFSAEQTVKANPISNTMTLFGDGYTIFGNPTGKAADNYGGGDLTTLTDLVQDLEFRFTGVPQDPNNPLESPVISGGSFATIRSRSSGAAIARIRIPFELWEVENNRQINVSIVDRNADGGSPWGDTGTPLWYRIRGRDYIIPIATPYDPDSAGALLRRNDPHSTWFIFFDGGENGNESSWDTGDKFLIVYANPIVPGTDAYSFTSPPARSFSADLAKQDISRINVFPNPYYGVNTEELNKYQKFVTFSHLPNKANIRIFNLSGVLVRTIHKNSNSQFERWNLSNESGLPVASGIYIAHIVMPEIGAEKIIKIAIIQEQQYLDRF